MTSVGSSRNWDLKLHGAGSGEPCPPLPPRSLHVCKSVEHAFIGDNFIDFYRQCQQTTISSKSHSIWRNLAEILFKYQLVKESTKLKVVKRRQRQPCLDSVKAGLYHELWRHRIPRLRADNRARENAWAESERQSSTWKLLIHLKKLKTDGYMG